MGNIYFKLYSADSHGNSIVTLTQRQAVHLVLKGAFRVVRHLCLNIGTSAGYSFPEKDGGMSSAAWTERIICCGIRGILCTPVARAAQTNWRP